MAPKTIRLDEITEGKWVGREEKWTQDRTLGPLIFIGWAEWEVSEKNPRKNSHWGRKSAWCQKTEESISKWEWLAVMNSTERQLKTENEKVPFDLKHRDCSFFKKIGDGSSVGKITESKFTWRWEWFIRKGAIGDSREKRIGSTEKVEALVK